MFLSFHIKNFFYFLVNVLYERNEGIPYSNHSLYKAFTIQGLSVMGNTTFSFMTQ